MTAFIVLVDLEKHIRDFHTRGQGRLPFNRLDLSKPKAQRFTSSKSGVTL